jgi:hypothetical protein
MSIPSALLIEAESFVDQSIFLEPAKLCCNHEHEESIRNIINFQENIKLLNTSSPGNLELLEQERKERIKKRWKKPIILETKRRKWSNDSIHKKIKRFFFIFLQGRIKSFINRDPSKIPYEIVSNSSIQFNKPLLISTVEEFYEKYCSISFNKDKMKEEKTEFEKLMKYQVKDIYSEFISTKTFNRNLKEMRKKESSAYCKRFLEVALNLVNYYVFLLPFKKKQPRNYFVIEKLNTKLNI